VYCTCTCSVIICIFKISKFLSLDFVELKTQPVQLLSNLAFSSTSTGCCVSSSMNDNRVHVQIGVEILLAKGMQFCVSLEFVLSFLEYSLGEQVYF
jgi:hypothetical protein